MSLTSYIHIECYSYLLLLPFLTKLTMKYCRNQQSLVDTHSTVKCSGDINEGKSPVTNNARTLRRQSLTGIPSSGSDRRSSLGGNTIDTGT